MFDNETEFVIENRHNPYRDSSLSITAKGALAYLLSTVGQISIADFRKDNNVGRDKAREIFNELDEHGYLTRERKNRELDGTFYWIMYVTYNPRTESQGMVPPGVKTPPTENQGMVEPPSPPSPSSPPLQSPSSPSSQDLLFPDQEKEEEPIPPIVPPSLKNVDIPDSLNDPRFFEAWEEWVQHRKEIRHTLKPTMISKQIKFLHRVAVTADVPAAVATAILDQSMTHGWQGLFDLDHKHRAWNEGWIWKEGMGEPVMTDAEYMRQFE